VGWRGDPDQIVFSVFDYEWYLNVAASPDACRLYKLGSVDDVTDTNPAVAARLREAGLREAERRGTDPRLIAWLRSGGTTRFPDQCAEWFGPSQWRTYWDRVYEE